MKLSELIANKEVEITSKRSLNSFLLAVEDAIEEGKLPIKGAAGLVTRNDLLQAARLPKSVRYTAASNKRETDWEFEEGEALEGFLASLRAGPSSTSTVEYKPKPTTAPLHRAVNELAASVMADVSDKELRTRVDNFLTVYKLSQGVTKNPPIRDDLLEMPSELPDGFELEPGAELGTDKFGRFGIQAVAQPKRKRGRPRKAA